MNGSTSEPGGDSQITDFDVNRPQRGNREGYFWRWLGKDQKYDEIILSMQPGKYDPRLYRMVRSMITTVVDDNQQLYLWNLLDGGINNIEKDDNLKSRDQKNEQIMNLCDIIKGMIWAYYDQYMGVSHRLKVGIVAAPGEEPELEDVIQV